MRICLVSGTFPPDSHGGTENYVLTVAKRLQSRGHEPFVLTTTAPDGISSLKPHREIIEGIDVWRFFPLHFAHRSTYERLSIPAQALWRLFDVCNPHAAATVNRFFARERPDVVHINDLEGISSLVPRTATRHGSRCVLTLHNYALVCPSASPRSKRVVDKQVNRSIGNHPLVCRGFSRLQRTALGDVDAAIGPSQYILDIHRSHGLFEDAECRMIQHGVKQVETETPLPTESSVLFVGRLHEIKGVKTLVQAAERLDDIHVHVCGTGPLADFVNEASDEQPNLTYHGYVSDERLAELREKVSAAIVPSLWPETSGLVIFESFSRGLPVIGSNVGGIPELVSPGERGQLFTAGDVRSLTRAVRTVVDSEVLPEMQQSALAWANKRTWERHMDALADVYNV
jgi:glycosyltransferase involved in cell wall biosynthesis